MESLTWRCARRTAAWDIISGKGRRLECGEVFLTADGLVSEELFGHQEAVRRDTQLGVTMRSGELTVRHRPLTAPLQQGHWLAS